MRLVVVRGFIREFLVVRGGRGCRVVSLCAGKGLDLLPVLSEQQAVQDGVVARLVELDAGLAAAAREFAVAEGLAAVKLADIVQQVQDAMWQPEYRRIQAS